MTRERNTVKLTKEWKVSSRSGEGSNCVEACAVDDGALVRDSKDRCGPVLGFGPQQWKEFVAGIKGGEFDLDR